MLLYWKRKVSAYCCWKLYQFFFSFADLFCVFFNFVSKMTFIWSSLLLFGGQEFCIVIIYILMYWCFLVWIICLHLLAIWQIYSQWHVLYSRNRNNIPTNYLQLHLLALLCIPRTTLHYLVWSESVLPFGHGLCETFLLWRVCFPR
jgi:hypothetical protein